jgi:diguanylate cyclase (GGDEF)-like protein
MGKGQESEVAYLLMTQYGITGKPFYTREEVTRMMAELHGHHLAASFEREMEILRINGMKALLEEEHAKSLEMLFQNEAKNLKLESLKARLEESYEHLEKLSRTDFLTKLNNRRNLVEIAEKEMKRAQRTKLAMDRIVRSEAEDEGAGKNIGVFSIALADVDGFKQINDAYGHAQGDIVLQRIGELLNSGIFRAADVYGRYGGDEFMFIFPDTRSTDAVIPAGKLIKAIAALDFGGEGILAHVTVSVGVSELHADDTRIDDSIERADMALYQAKKNGRNQLAVFESLERGGGFPDMKNTDAQNCLHFTMRPIWDKVEKLGSEIGPFLDGFDKELVYDVQMAVVELVENAVKYGSSIKAKDEIQIDISLKGDLVVIEVTNWVHEARHLEKAKETIRLINDSDDPKALYVARLKSLMEEEFGRSGSQLGLLRIAYIGGFAIEYHESGDGCLTIRAMKALDAVKA